MTLLTMVSQPVPQVLLIAIYQRLRRCHLRLRRLCNCPSVQQLSQRLVAVEGRGKYVQRRVGLARYHRCVPTASRERLVRRPDGYQNGQMASFLMMKTLTLLRLSHRAGWRVVCALFHEMLRRDAVVGLRHLFRDLQALHEVVLRPRPDLTHGLAAVLRACVGSPSGLVLKAPSPRFCLPGQQPLPRTLMRIGLRMITIMTMTRCGS
jgi:hypothetical protein